MAFFLYRYYYLMADEPEKSEQLSQALTQAGFLSEYKPQKARGLSHLQYSTMSIQVAEIMDAGDTWTDALNLLEECEKAAGVGRDLLGKITVLGSSNNPWENVLNMAHGLCPYRDLIQFNAREGVLARLDWKWPHGHAYYLYATDSPGPAVRRFLQAGLPILEASLIRLNMVNNLCRDRKSVVDRERQEIESRLSHVLHTQLVANQGTAKEADELEDQIKELSSAYGILAGDYSLISEMAVKLQTLIDDVMQNIKGQRLLDISAETMDTMLHPYRSRVIQLKQSVEDLKVSRENHQAAINVVRSRIDIMMSRENIETQARIKDLMELNTSIQQQSLTFQVAAGIIEFIVLAYYSHSLWKSLAHNAYAVIPPWLQGIVVVLFSYATVVFTHLVAEHRQGHEHVKKKLLIYGLLLAAILVVVIVGSAVMESGGAH